MASTCAARGPTRTRSAAAAVALALALFALPSCARSAERLAEARGSCAKAHAAGQTEQAITVDGAERRYLLYVPDSYDAEHRAAVVMNFHGFGSSAAQQIGYGDFRPLADRDGFLVVAPDGQGTPRHFNLSAQRTAEADDVAFAVAIADELVRTLCVDANRIYATGMSNGGAMSSILGCRASATFAAVGPVAAVVQPVAGCERSRPIAIAAFMGTDDPIVPFAGGTVSCCGNPTIGGAPQAMAAWAEHNGCARDPVIETRSPEVDVHRWASCRDGSATEFYVIKGGGHTWPGAPSGRGRLGSTTDDISASETLWEFFKAHPKP